ncbi:hypothetical protein BDP81DRAFT_421846, partial [Colletotrichum phormii]
MQQPPWHRGPRQTSGAFFHVIFSPVRFILVDFLLLSTSSNGFKTRHATRFKQLIRTPSPFIPRQSSHGPPSSASPPPYPEV